MKNLELRRRRYSVVLDVPRALRPIIGKARLKRPLGTGDGAEARKMRDSGVLADMKAMLVEAAGRAGSGKTLAGIHDWLAVKAAEQREKAEKLMQEAIRERELAEWAISQIKLGNPAHPAVTTCESIPSFRDTAERYIADNRAKWRRDEWTPSLTRHVFPHLGDVPVNRIDTPLILRFLKPLWQSHPETGDKVRGRIEAVLDYARVHGWRAGENPAAWTGNLEHSLPNKRKLKPIEHHPAMPWQSVPAFLAELASREGMDAKALIFAILTAARTDEVLGATWDEIDLVGRVWTVPPTRMKGGRQHRVPLSPTAVALLKGLPQRGPYVFHGRQGKLSHSTFYNLLHAMGRADVTAHGFRASFRQWCQDTGKAEDIAEHALAHVKGDATQRAYARSDVFERRRDLMDEWGEYCLSAG